MNIVIVGNSIAAIEAIKSIRTFDHSSNLTVLSKEDHVAYSRPLITEYLTGEKTYEEILYVSPEFYKEQNVEFHKGVSAKSIVHNQNVVKTSDNQEIQYDRLLITSGSSPISPPIPGVAFEGVHSFWTIDDAQAIAKQIDYVENAVVIGAGLVCMSAVHALHHLEIPKIFVVEMLDRVLAPSLDIFGSEILHNKIKQLGIDLWLGKKAKEIKDSETHGKVSSVILDDETEIPCDIAIVSTGIRPNVDFLKGAPVNIEDGIIVDQYLETSLTGTFAAGDVTQSKHAISNENQIMANLPNAKEQGRVAGVNLVGQNVPYRGGLPMTSMRYFGIPFVSMGYLSKIEPHHKEFSFSNNEQSIYRKVVTSQDTLVGAVLVGDIDQAGIIMGLISDKISIPDPQGLIERNEAFEIFRKDHMKEEMEGSITWKESIGLDQPWKKKREKIPVHKEEEK